jgi:hypothetical protein
VTAAFPDATLFTADNAARSVGIELSDALHDLGAASTRPASVSVQVKLPAGTTVHPGGVITVGDGTSATDVQIPSGSDATQIATLIGAALTNGGGVDYTGTGTTYWEVAAAGAFLTFTAADSSGADQNGVVVPGVLTQLITDVTGGTANHGIQAKADSANVADATGLLELVDDTAPVITQTDFGDNGIRISFTGTDGTAQVGNQIGTTHGAREALGDADYLDFSAYDACAVVVGSSNTTAILSVTDTAELHRYVRIVERTGDQSGTYDFTLYDAGTDGIGGNDASLGLIGTVDFGESVNFVRTDFILFNDILV